MRSAVLTSLALLSAMVGVTLEGQIRGGSIAGRVTDADTRAISGASVRLVGTPLAVRTRDDGSFRIDNVPSGSYTVRVAFLGFAPDTARVSVDEGRAAELQVRLRPVAIQLASMFVTSHRMGETEAAALDRQKEADNLVTVLAGDQIRGLPNYNAAEAAGRMPDVGIERDEGEGKFVQIRGTEPRLSNVTIDGVHVPGTENGNRIPKLDDVPSDILAAIEVSKTLTADMDADAIGGSLNLVTKTPEGRPHGHLAGQYGRIGLLSRDVGQTSLTYGGRYGQNSRLGLLVGGSYDRNNRGINDVEPSWAVDSTGRSFPNEWSQRDYTYYRTRYGLAGDVDYRFTDHSSVYLKGLWSMFMNHGTRYVYDVSTGASAFADTINKSAVGDSAASGATGYGTGAVVTREVSQRTPTEQREHAAALKFGVRLRDESKNFTQNSPVFQAIDTLRLSQVVGGFSDPSYYSAITSAYQPYGPMPDLNATNGWENNHRAAFTNVTDSIRNALATFSGSERIYAGYVMNTTDFGRLRVNVGLRLEATRSAYSGHVAATDTTKTPQTTVTSVSATQTYTDLFPSAPSCATRSTRTPTSVSP